MNKVLLGLLAAVLTTVIAAKLVYEATTDTGSQPAHQPWAQNTMEFQTWNHEQWTAWIRGNAFEQRPQNTGKWSRHANPSIAFIDWEGKAWQAKIDGEAFLLAHRGNWEGAIERAIAIRYRNWQGEKKLRTVAQLRR